MKSNAKPDTMSRRERQIMDIIYARGSLTATGLQEALSPEKLSNSSVRTFLRILVEKGMLSHHREGRQYIYTPTEERPKAGLSAMNRVLDVFFNGSLQEAVAGLMDSEQVSEDELVRLEEMIEQARKEGR